MLPTNHVVITENFNKKYVVFWAQQKKTNLAKFSDRLIAAVR
jgi:hypothetical protein